MRTATMWIVLSQLLAVPAFASDLEKSVEIANAALEKTSGIAISTNGVGDVWVDVTTFPHLRQSVGVFADPPSEKLADPPDPDADPPCERGASVLVDLSEDGHTLTVYLADPPDPDLGMADPPDPDADPPDPDHQIRIVVDSASIGSLTFVDSEGLPLILTAVGDPFVGDPFVGDPFRR